jgi:hypothetical protein
MTKKIQRIGTILFMMAAASCSKDAPAPVEVTGVAVASPTLTLAVGETATLTATIIPDNAADKTLAWTSSACRCPPPAGVAEGRGWTIARHCRRNALRLYLQRTTYNVQRTTYNL